MYPYASYQLWQFFRFFLVFDNVDSFEGHGKVFFKSPSIWDLSDIFLMIRLEFMGFEEENHRA